MQSITPLLYDHELGKRKAMSDFGFDAIVGGNDIMMMMMVSVCVCLIRTYNKTSNYGYHFIEIAIRQNIDYYSTV